MPKFGRPQPASAAPQSGPATSVNVGQGRPETVPLSVSPWQLGMAEWIYKSLVIGFPPAWQVASSSASSEFKNFGNSSAESLHKKNAAMPQLQLQLLQFVHFFPISVGSSMNVSRSRTTSWHNFPRIDLGVPKH